MAELLQNTGAAQALTLSEFGNKLRSGDLSSVNGKLIIDLENVSKTDFHTLIELVRHKSFGHDILRRLNYELESSDDEMGLIDALRNHNLNGEFDRALSLVEDRDVSKNHELLLEKARSYVFLGRFDEAIAILKTETIEKVPVLNTQGVLYQLLGHARLEKGELEMARISLIRALDIAKTIGNRSNEISCHLFLSKYSSFKGDFQASAGELSQAVRLLRDIRNFRWLLGFYRTLSHHHFLAGSAECFGAALTGALIARALQDQTYFVKGILEFVTMQRRFRVDFFADDTALNEVLSSPLINNVEDLQILKTLATSGQLPGQVKTLTHSIFAGALSSLAFLNGEFQCPDLKAALDIKWIYDSKNGILIDLAGSNFEFLAPESPLAKMIVLLNKTPEPIPMPEAFAQIWDVEWQPARHENTLKVSIGRIGRMSPSVKIRRRNKSLVLEQKGIVL